MTLTATRPPEVPAPVTELPVLVPETWLTTSDHKRLGRMYIVATLVFLLVGTGVGVAMEIQRAGRHTSVAVGADYARLFSLHATVTALLFLAPLWVGLATYLVPLQIGARRLAFPRLQAFAFWAYAAGGTLLLVSYVVGRPNGGGITLSSPLPPAPGGANHATNLWIASLMIVTIAALFAAANIFVTVFKLRADGMTMMRVPVFTWSALATSAAILLAAPIFLGK